MSNIPLLRPTYNYNGNLPPGFEPVYAIITTHQNHGSQYTPMFVVDMFRFDSNEKVLVEQLYHNKMVPTEWVQGKWPMPSHTSLPNAHYALANRIATIFS
ncbi:MAG: hypothetical protein AABW92_01225, partial [Nanoarchaeota archaeon]